MTWTTVAQISLIVIVWTFCACLLIAVFRNSEDKKGNNDG